MLTSESYCLPICQGPIISRKALKFQNKKKKKDRLGIDAKAVNNLIARNARVAQDQKEYNERYDALVSRYEETEHRRDAVIGQIDQIMIRRRKIERFIESVKTLPELITAFDESLWAGLGDNGNP